MEQKVDWRCLALISAQFCRKIVELNVNWPLQGLCFFKEDGKDNRKCPFRDKVKETISSSYYVILSLPIYPSPKLTFCAK